MRPVQSPRTDDSTIEQEIKAKGLNAPRVTMADIEDNMVHVEYVKQVTHSGQVLRWAVITTRNGFAVTGRPSASVSPENDDAEIGKKVALDNARQEMWSLMGYALKDRLAGREPTPAGTFLDRLRTEHSELRERLTKLRDALDNDLL